MNGEHCDVAASPVVKKLRGLVPLVLAAALSACDQAPTAPNTGQLSVAISGLPVGVQALVAINGPNGYVQAIPSSRVLSDLPEGTYTVAASPVTTGVARFVATPATQTVVVSGGAPATASSIGYAVATAALAVNVLGLPSASPGNVNVTGPGGFTRTILTTTTIALLDPGTYTVSASDVQAAGKAYRPDPATQTLSLVASTSPRTAEVFYGGGSGSLDMTVSGLPVGTNASITITGAGSFTRTMTSSTTLRYLDAGSYTISAAIVGSNLTTHIPSPASQASAVTDGGTTAAVVMYGSAPLQLGLQFVAEGLTEPVFLSAPSGDARLFIVERNGRIRIVEDNALLSTPFLDITARVNFVGERGMLSMAFDPQYQTNGRFYVYYVDLRGDIAVERFASTPGSNVAGGSEGVVIGIPHGRSEHHGGLMAFGPDGMLYLAPGDGGCCGDPFNNAQNTFSLLGKILRIDVATLPYTIPFGNPFIGHAASRPEIWAVGLRSPWRFAFDAPSGMLYLADVGQDAHEEVNVAAANAAGLNYGWPRMEGFACFNPTTNCSSGLSLTLPVLAYPHSEGCSVTGGYVYRGSAIPELTGHYLYSDYCRGWLRSFRFTAGSATEQRSWPGIAIPWSVSFGSDGAGELYMIANARVWRIVRP